MSWAMVAAFAGVVLLGAVSPGPDFALVVRRAAVAGRVGGTMTALGVAVGVFLWADGAATGVAAVVAASLFAYTVVKLVGAAYLVVLGARALVAARTGAVAPRLPLPARRAAVAGWRSAMVCCATC